MRPNYFIFIGYLKTGEWEGETNEPSEPPLDPLLICHNQRQQTSQRHREDEAHKTKRHTTARTQPEFTDCTCTVIRIVDPHCTFIYTDT